MAGVKDEKSFYKKYPTEAAFLKAHPKAKAELKKFATGGQMNAQAMQQFAGGGSIFKDIGAGLYGVGEGLLDTVTLGATDQITDMGYKALQKAGGSTEDEIREQDSIHGFSQAAGAIGGAVINPAGTGAAIGQTGKGLGEGISKGNESEEWARTTGQALNAAGAIGSIAYGNFGAAGTSGAANAGASAAGNASKLTGQSAKFAGSDFGKFAQTAGKYGSIAGQMGSVLQPMFNQQYGNNQGYKMGGQMQYSMGGEIQYANGGTGEINAEVEDNENAIGPNGEFTQFSGPTHAEGGIETDMAPGTMIFSDKLKMPGSKKSFADLNKLYDTNKEDDVLSNEKSNNTLRLTAMLMRDAKLKQSLALFQEQEQFKQDKVAAYAKRMGVQIPSQDNEQMEPQGMPEQSQGEMAIGKHGGMMNYMAMGGIQESDYQTDPGKLPSLLRQQKANDATILGMRSSFGRNADTNNVEDPLVVTFNKAKNYGKELADKIKNHPEFKKEMGGKLPMYQDGAVVPASGSSNYFNTPSLNNESINQYKFQQFLNNKERGFSAPQSTFNPYSVESWKFQQQLDKDGALYGNSAELVSDQYTPAQNWNAQGLAGKINPNAGSPSGNVQGNLGVQGPPKIEGEGFDWANAGKQVGNFALQNAGNIYDLYRSTQDNSKLNLARYSPELLSAEKSLFDNQRMYSEGKRQTAEASGGNASTYLGNLGALRGQKMAADLDTRVQFGNINAQIANAAKLYNAGAIDKETMFKLQSEGANRDMFASGSKGVSQNIINQQNTNRKFASEDELFKAVKGDFSLYFRIKEAQRLAEEKAKGELS